MKAIVLAGGTGSRLRPLTHTANKHLIPIANKPILRYVIESIKKAGIKDIGIILGYNDPEAIKDYFGNGSKIGVHIEYIFQGEAKGIAHAVYCAKDFIGDDEFVVHLGDNILKNGIKDMVNDFKKKEVDVLINLCKVDDPTHFGIVEFGKDGKIKRFVEKPKRSRSNLAIIGVYFFKPFIFDIIKRLKPSWRNELEITDALEIAYKSGYKFDVHIIKGWWKDTGKPEDLLEVNRLILDHKIRRKIHTKRIEKNAKIHGRVEIGKGTIIEGNTIIKGPVVIGNNCRIRNSYIGPYTSIGDGTIIESTEIEDSIIVGECEIINIHKIVDSIIGKNCKIRKSERLPKGSRLVVGENSLLMF